MVKSYLVTEDGKLRNPRCEFIGGVAFGRCENTADWVAVMGSGARFYICSKHLQDRGFDGIVDLDNVRIPNGMSLEERVVLNQVRRQLEQTRDGLEAYVHVSLAHVRSLLQAMSRMMEIEEVSFLTQVEFGILVGLQKSMLQIRRGQTDLDIPPDKLADLLGALERKEAWFKNPV